MHQDPDVARGLTIAIEALCNYAKATGRESVLLLVPYPMAEEVICAVSGKLQSAKTSDVLAELGAAFTARSEGKGPEIRVAQFIHETSEKIANFVRFTAVKTDSA